jgi:hypothetical protein
LSGYFRVVTLPLDMASDFEKWVLEETLKAEIVDCLVYEASKRVAALATEENHYHNVFIAFANLGRVALILGDRFEKVRQELRERAREALSFSSSFEFAEKDLKTAEMHGLMYGWGRSLPVKIGVNSIHCGFVAEMVAMELRGRLRYVEGEGWEFLEAGAWRRRSKERGILGLIYDVMKRKIKTWREVLSNPLGEGGWLEKLEKNINDTDWLRKVEELLLRIDYFGVEIVSNNADSSSDGKAGGGLFACESS